MRGRRFLWLMLLLWVACWFYLSGAVAATQRKSHLPVSRLQKNTEKVQHLELEIGHSHVVKVPFARQVAVGDSQTLQATAVSASEVIVFGKRAGSTTVDVWNKAGKRYRFEVLVRAAGYQQALMQVKALLADVQAVRVQTEGSHIVLHGKQLSAEERQIVDRILVRFPEVVDMTGSLTWDPMVLLDVLVIELPIHKLSELGVQWQATKDSGSEFGAAWRVATLSGAPSVVSESPAAWFGARAVMNASAQSMAERGEAILLAQPQLMTRAGKTASFLAGGEIPYAVTDEKGRSHTEFKKYGVSLSMTPELAQQDRVMASVEVEVSAVDPSISTPAGPAMRVRKTHTQFNALSGQTVVLAGFMTSDRSLNYQGLLGNKRGVFDALTGKNSQNHRQTELIILVTPLVMFADDVSMADRARRARVYAQLEDAGQVRLNTRPQYVMPEQKGRLKRGLSSLTMQSHALQENTGFPEPVNELESLAQSAPTFAQSSSAWEQFHPQTHVNQWVDQTP